MQPVSLSQLTKAEIESLPIYTVVTHKTRFLVGYICQNEGGAKWQAKVHVAWMQDLYGVEITPYCQNNKDVCIIDCISKTNILAGIVAEGNVPYLQKLIHQCCPPGSHKAYQMMGLTAKEMYTYLLRKGYRYMVDFLHHLSNALDKQEPMKDSTDYINSISGERLSEFKERSGTHADFFSRNRGVSTGLALNVICSAIQQPYHWITCKGLESLNNVQQHVLDRNMYELVLLNLGKLEMKGFECNKEGLRVRFNPFMKEEIVYEKKSIITPYR